MRRNGLCSYSPALDLIITQALLVLFHIVVHFSLGLQKLIEWTPFARTTFYVRLMLKKLAMTCHHLKTMVSQRSAQISTWKARHLHNCDQLASFVTSVLSSCMPSYRLKGAISSQVIISFCGAFRSCLFSNSCGRWLCTYLWLGAYSYSSANCWWPTQHPDAPSGTASTFLDESRHSTFRSWLHYLG